MGVKTNKLHKDGGVQARVKVLIDDYIKVFPQEYEDIKKDIRDVKLRLRNPMATTGKSNVMERELYRISETLQYGLRQGLTDEQWEWLQSKEGARWFTKTFDAFRITDKI